MAATIQKRKLIVQLVTLYIFGLCTEKKKGKEKKRKLQSACSKPYLSFNGVL